MPGMTDRVLTELLPCEGALLWTKRALLVAGGVAALVLAAKVKVALPGTPVPMNLGTLAVLSVGAAYGARLGMVTLLAWMALGVLGFNVFAGTEAGDPAKLGWAYMAGGTGGYLLGYLLAAGALGLLARRGWDRSVTWMAAAMIIGTALIYLPGLVWLRGFAADWTQTLAWGLTPFLAGDLVKLALAALLFPALWKLVGAARA